MSKKRYERLEGRIEREYKRKGYATARASYIAHAAAGKVARERRKTRRNPGLLFGLSLAQLALAGGAAVVAHRVITGNRAVGEAGSNRPGDGTRPGAPSGPIHLPYDKITGLY